MSRWFTAPCSRGAAVCVSGDRRQALQCMASRCRAFTGCRAMLAALSGGGCLLLVAAVALYGCALRPQPRPREAESRVAQAAAMLIAGLGPLPAGEKFLWGGIRDSAGKHTPATRLLDEYLVSALLLDGLRLELAAVPESWDEAAAPASLWQQAAGARVLAARLEQVDAWGYLRLWLIEGGTGRVLATSGGQLRERYLQEQLASKARLAAEPAAVAVEAVLEVEFHRLASRTEGGVAQLVEVQEEGVLQAGDRLQVRFRTTADCQVFAFLYSTATGARRELFPSQQVYSGRWQYGPGQETWIELNEADQVYTLYFLAGPRLPAERDEWWERFGELFGQGQVNRFEGLEELDRTLIELLRREAPSEATLQVQRGASQISRGDVERFFFEDGASFESRAEQLRGAPYLVRAVTFAVQ